MLVSIANHDKRAQHRHLFRTDFPVYEKNISSVWVNDGARVSVAHECAHLHAKITASGNEAISENGEFVGCS